jgi:NADPH:quinone reductase-like Zn-dependent oxidoreductase
MPPAPSSKMLSLCISSYSKPSGYGLAQFAKPVIEADNEVVIKVHAASINPVDAKKAGGMMKMAVKDRLDIPLKQRKTQF